MKNTIFAVIILNLFLLQAALAEGTVKIAVIDTGIDTQSTWENTKQSKPVLCKDGTYDFTNMVPSKQNPKVKVPSTSMTDDHGHGTHIAGIIANKAKKANYCIVALKFYDRKRPAHGEINTNNSLRKAIELKVDIINYSAGGNYKNEEECRLVKKALDSGIIVIAAAGNDGKDFSTAPFYPAMCDSRVIVAENVYEGGGRHPTSNFSGNGSVKTVKKVGVDVESILPGNRTGLMTGTSQAAAVISGEMALKISNSRAKRGGK